MTVDVYDKIYFKDEESRRFAEMRKQYGDRARSAIRRAATSNVTEWIDLRPHGEDGGVTIHSTKDFVAYFNERFPRYDGKERLPMIRERIAEGQRRRAQMPADANFFSACGEKSREKANAVKKERKIRENVFAFRRFSLVRVALCLMLVCAIGILFGTSLALDAAEKKVTALEQEVEALQATGNERPEIGTLADTSAEASGYTLSASDTVEVFTPETKDRSVRIGVLASLGK